MSLSKNEMQAALAKAQKEVQEERIKVAVEKLKVLYRQQAEAKAVLDNIEREITDYERAAADGNI